MTYREINKRSGEHSRNKTSGIIIILINSQHVCYMNLDLDI